MKLKSRNELEYWNVQERLPEPGCGVILYHSHSAKFTLATHDPPNHRFLTMIDGGHLGLTAIDYLVNSEHWWWAYLVPPDPTELINRLDKLRKWFSNDSRKSEVKNLFDKEL